MKTALQIFEENEKKKCCLNCAKLIVKNNAAGHINFCKNSGKIVLDMFLNSGNLRDCDFEEKR